MRAGGIDHREHLRAFQRRLEEMGLDAALILDRPSTHWLTGFRGTASTLLVLRRSAVFITDFRYIESARSRLRGVHVALQRNPLDSTASPPTPRKSSISFAKPARKWASSVS